MTGDGRCAGWAGRQRAIAAWAVLSVVLVLSGCAAAPPSNPAVGPAAKSPVTVTADRFGGVASHKVVTPHYLIRTTIDSPELVENLAQVMEGALGEYRKLAPGVPLTADPLLCFVFADRNQWAQFTEAQTGGDAKVYLRINRGGYAVRDWYVSYFIGDRETYQVAAHEGFHQYVGRHFKRRPPPFLEEGLATVYEFVDWQNGLPRWRTRLNPHRFVGLERSVEQQMLTPLAELCTMHAGQVVSKQLGRVEAFYAQAWAFARFLDDGEGGRYRPALQRMLADLAADRVPLPEFARPTPPGTWDPRTARPLLEYYLGESLERIDRQYLAYVRQLVAAGQITHRDD
ncbi:MAG: hypothetical protein JWO31_1809 [Phycisphaerales bacterium]|nr:hypothetical protein [Phycisphaerales bacterium]